MVGRVIPTLPLPPVGMFISVTGDGAVGRLGVVDGGVVPGHGVLGCCVGRGVGLTGWMWQGGARKTWLQLDTRGSYTVPAIILLLTYVKCNFPMKPHVRLLVDWMVFVSRTVGLSDV